MNFGQAIEALKEGKKVARSGWNGKGMFLVYVSGSDVAPYHGTPYHDSKIIDDDGRVKINPHIDMRTATGEMQPGWLASQTDMLADDWSVVDADPADQ
jgi:hypothetical protein